MKKLLLILTVVVLVVVVATLYSSRRKYGAQTVNYSNSLSNANLYNSLASVVQDLTAVRAPLAGLLQSTATLNAATLGPIGVSTSTASTTVTVTGAVVGDSVILGTSTSTANVDVTGQVSAANTVTVYAKNMLGAANSMATTTITATVLPKASFIAPSALNTVTSTSN